MHAGAALDKAPLPTKGNEPDPLAVEVERLKEELELVSYATSHDLLAPLRFISFYAAELNKNPVLTADPAGQKALQKITREVTRMKTLIEGLREYLNLETFVPATALIDGNLALTSALAALQGKIESSGAKITYDALPQIQGHLGRLTRLFTCLLDNALKFGGPRPLIHVSVRRTQEGWEFSVEDHGIGIDSDYHNIIFDLFQRLNPEGEYPGDGIGLALSRKILQVHGGKLGVESKLGEGSRFKFTLPATGEIP